MYKITKREYDLTQDEVAEALRYWLVNKLDMPLGENDAHFQWNVAGTEAVSCTVTTTDTDNIETDK